MVQECVFFIHNLSTGNVIGENVTHHCVSGTTSTTACCMNASTMASAPKEDLEGTHSSLNIFLMTIVIHTFCRLEPKRLLVPRVEKAKSSQSFDHEFVILPCYFL